VLLEQHWLDEESVAMTARLRSSNAPQPLSGLRAIRLLVASSEVTRKTVHAVKLRKTAI
jgi:hypothetical protein